MVMFNYIAFSLALISLVLGAGLLLKSRIHADKGCILPMVIGYIVVIVSVLMLVLSIFCGYKRFEMMRIMQKQDHPGAIQTGFGCPFTFLPAMMGVGAPGGVGPLMPGMDKRMMEQEMMNKQRQMHRKMMHDMMMQKMQPVGANPGQPVVVPQPQTNVATPPSVQQPAVQGTQPANSSQPPVQTSQLVAPAQEANKAISA